MCKGKWSKYFKHYGVPDKPTYGKSNKYLTESIGYGDVFDLKHMMSTEPSVVDKPVRGVDAKQGPDGLETDFLDDDAPEPSLPHAGACYWI